MKNHGMVLACILLLASTASCTGDPDWAAYDPIAGSEAFQLPSKADGLVSPLTVGATVKGSVAGPSVALYRLELQAGSVLQAEVSKSSGDLEPQAFLYRELSALEEESSFISPLPGYSYGGGQLSIAWNIVSSGTYYLVVKAYRSQSAGAYELTVQSSAVPETPTGPFSEQPPGSLPDEDCLLGEELYELEQQQGFHFQADLVIHADTVSLLSPPRRLQFLRGLQLSGWWWIQTFQEALTEIQDGVLIVTPFSSADGRNFVRYIYHAGDNPHGFVFADADQPVMLFCDDAPCSCAITVGGGCYLKGENLYEIIDSFFATGPMIGYTKENFVEMPAILKQQLHRGIEVQLRKELATPEEAFAEADPGPYSPYVQTQTLITSEGARFVLFDLTLGGNGYGFIFPDAETVLAFYGDGNRWSCLAPVL